MNNALKQSTAAVLKLGPFIDSDGTPLTGLNIAASDILLSKNGGGFAASHNAAVAAHDTSGYYNVSLDATDTDTPGLLRLMVDKSADDALPVFRDCTVLPAEIYNALIEATATLSTTAAVVNDKTGYSLASEYDAAKTAAQASNIPAAEQIADAVLARNVAYAEASAPKTSLATAILAITNKSNTFANSGYLTIYRTDGVTEHVKIAVSTDSDAQPIDGVG